MAKTWATAVVALLAALQVACLASGASTRVEGGRPCLARQYNYSSVVCVCNATYCDAPPPQPALQSGVIAHYTSSLCGQRLTLRLRNFTQQVELEDGAARLQVNTSEQFQEMLGFGGAMSDSTAINIRALSLGTQFQLLLSYFGSGDGSSRYSLVRVPMGGTDFSVRNYTYDDSKTPDPSLKKFALQPEDTQYKIPLLRLAQKLSGNGLKIHAAPWSAPSWMKGTNGTAGFNWLQTRYYQTWANYFVKFLQQYRQRGVDMWAVSLQNEPTSGSVVNYGVNNLGWTPPTMRRFLENNLGPTLRRQRDRVLAATDIFIGEDVRSYLDWSQEILEGKEARRLTSGVALHWYGDTLTDPAMLDQLHNNHSDLFILYTEACYGPFLGVGFPAVRLGMWDRAENYTSDIIQVTNHWTSGWEDWNMVVNEEGGPNWLANYVDASIVSNATADEFYKQPMYYAIAHFSRFVPRGSRRVGLRLDAGSTDVESVAFLTPNGDVAVVLQNKQGSRRSVVLRDPQLGDATLSLPAHSMHTLVYQRADNAV